MDNTRAMKEFIDILNNHSNLRKAYDFIVSNFWRFTKEDLRQIILELLYALYHNGDEEFNKDILKKCAESLDDIYTEYWKKWG